MFDLVFTAGLRFLAPSWTGEAKQQKKRQNYRLLAHKVVSQTKHLSADFQIKDTAALSDFG